MLGYRIRLYGAVVLYVSLLDNRQYIAQSIQITIEYEE
jgi:hypothetical protein